MRPARNQGLLHLVWEAVRGSRVDFTKESLGRSVLLLAIPMVIEMFAESLFAVVDMFWVGKLGPAAQATVTLTESWLVLIYALCIGLSIGATAVVARRTGEKKPEAAARAAVQAIWMGLAFSVVVAGLGIALAPQLLVWMDASPAVVATGTGYTRVLLGGSVTVVLLFMLNAVFRGAGDAAITMRTLWLANIINIVLCPFFVFGWGPFPELGVMGAAVATTIGRGCGVLFQLYNLFGGKRRLQHPLGARRHRPRGSADHREDRPQRHAAAADRHDQLDAADEGGERLRQTRWSPATAWRFGW